MCFILWGLRGESQMREADRSRSVQTAKRKKENWRER